MKISTYFTVPEVGKSYTATRLGLDNTPTPEALAAAKALATEVLDPIRQKFGPYSPQSWYRSEALERAITWDNGFRQWCDRHNKDWAPMGTGGAVEDAWGEYFSGKSHPKGQAADIEVPGVTNDYLFRWVYEHLRFDQLIREFPKKGDPASGWVHVSYKTKKNRNEAFSIPWDEAYNLPKRR